MPTQGIQFGKYISIVEYVWNRQISVNASIYILTCAWFGRMFGLAVPLFSKLSHFSLGMLHFRAPTQAAFALLKDEESSFLKPTDFKNIHDLVSHRTRQTKKPGQTHVAFSWCSRATGLRPEESRFEVGGQCLLKHLNLLFSFRRFDFKSSQETAR